MEPGVDFSQALRLCKAGHKIARAGWNKSGQWVVLQKGCPDGVPINKNAADATRIPQGTVCKFAPYFMIYNAQGIFVPWVATQGDLLAEDLEVFEFF